MNQITLYYKLDKRKTSVSKNKKACNSLDRLLQALLTNHPIQMDHDIDVPFAIVRHYKPHTRFR